MKLAMALLTRSRDAPTMPANSSWVTGRMKSSTPSDNSSKRFAVLPGTLGDHLADRTRGRPPAEAAGAAPGGRRRAGDAQALRQEPGDAPQQPGVAAERVH